MCVHIDIHAFYTRNVSVYRYTYIIYTPTQCVYIQIYIHNIYATVTDGEKYHGQKGYAENRTDCYERLESIACVQKCDMTCTLMAGVVRKECDMTHSLRTAVRVYRLCSQV